MTTPMDGPLRQIVVRVIAAMDDAEFAQPVSEARGLTTQQVAQLVDSSQWANAKQATDQQAAKQAAAQALRTRQGV